MISRRPLFTLLIALLGFMSTAAHADKPFWRPVHWKTSDGVLISARYHAPAKPEHFQWVLLHGLGSSQGEWDAIAHTLAKHGDGILTYDARGHGESTTTVKGEPVDYRQWRNAGPGTPRDRMTSDLDTAVQALRVQFQAPPALIAVGGASLGANVALRYAGANASVPAVILLSPGLEYAGVRSEDAFRRTKSRPVFMAVSTDDRYAAASVGRLASLRGDDKLRVVERPGAAHGVNMFDDRFAETLLSWIQTVETP
jgi:pimeloyl-ACP methyl ester carboxylesterase